MTPERDEELYLPTVPEADQRRSLNDWMQPLSMVVSAVALGFMFLGLAAAVAADPQNLTIPGDSGLTPDAWLESTLEHPGLVHMSAGVFLLGLLPILRVGASLLFYARERAPRDVAAALAVLTLLALSMLLK